MCLCFLIIHSTLTFLLGHREDAPEARPSQMPPASKILKGEEPSKAKATPAARQRETGSGAKISGQEDRTEPAKEPSHRDVSGGRSDVDAEQRQKGWIH